MRGRVCACACVCVCVCEYRSGQLLKNYDRIIICLYIRMVKPLFPPQHPCVDHRPSRCEHVSSVLRNGISENISGDDNIPRLCYVRYSLS